MPKRSIKRGVVSKGSSARLDALLPAAAVNLHKICLDSFKKDGRICQPNFEKELFLLLAQIWSSPIIESIIIHRQLGVRATVEFTLHSLWHQSKLLIVTGLRPIMTATFYTENT